MWLLWWLLGFLTGATFIAYLSGRAWHRHRHWHHHPVRIILRLRGNPMAQLQTGASAQVIAQTPDGVLVPETSYVLTVEGTAATLDADVLIAGADEGSVTLIATATDPRYLTGTLEVEIVLPPQPPQQIVLSLVPLA